MTRPRPWLTRLLWLAGLLAAAGAPSPGWAGDMALLVGVADYPELPRRLWLRGPINDVALMRQTLVKRGMEPAAVRVLVSRAGPADEPTRANIVAAMANVLAETRSGDRVLLFLAGHGSQQPQPQRRGTRPSEADGLDEVFLPADVRAWNGQGAQATIPNALLDDEIGAWMDALVDKGAKVWGVFDTCHAAGMARGHGTTRWRALAGVELGIPQGRATKQRAKTVSRPAATVSTAPAGQASTLRLDGRTLAFAARSNELTGEEWLPRGGGLQASRIHGVFSFHLAQALQQAAGTNAAALDEAIRKAYRQEQRVSPTPVFLGEVQGAWP